MINSCTLVQNKLLKSKKGCSMEYRESTIRFKQYNFINL